MILVVPMYEPNPLVMYTLETLNRIHGFTIVVVDDGCRVPALLRESKRCGYTILHLGRHKGEGEACKAAFGYLQEKGVDEPVICINELGEFGVDAILAVAAALGDRPGTIVVGGRTWNQKLPFKHRMAQELSSRFLAMSAGTKIKDVQSQLHGYPASALPWLRKVDGEGKEYRLNILMGNKEAKVPITEVPVTMLADSELPRRPLLNMLRLYLPVFKFSLSSFAAGVIDFVLLDVFKTWFDPLRLPLGSLLWSVIAARLVSSFFNFTVNRLLVFRARHISVGRSGVKYFGLVIVILFFNYWLLAFFSEVLPIPLNVAKIMTEVLLFTGSYFVQRFFVFRQKAKKN
ncbi:MAG: GtrA family protein [Oscillospiraceae bacterium]|nr:GtrA family protein [Oscillospiraceae bacterium]